MGGYEGGNTVGLVACEKGCVSRSTSSVLAQYKLSTN